MRKLLSSLVVIASTVGLIGSLGVMPAHAVLQGHCKNDSHVDELLAPAGATLIAKPDVEVTMITAVAGDCINDPTYVGPLWVVTNNGNKQIHLEPSAAAELKNGFADLAPNAAEFRHTNSGDYIVFGDYTNAARLKIVNQLTALGA
jgi:inosine-uridine nucleoside N-ribohydrolase